MAAAVLGGKPMSFIMGILICAAGFAMIVFGGVNPARLLDYKALVLAVAGTLGIMFVISPLPAILQNISTVAKTLRKRVSSQKLILQIMELVQMARHDGILALEGCEAGITDAILKKGLILVAGSADRETIKSILLKDAEKNAEEEKSAQEFIEHVAMMSPVIGMIGTLVEIVQMLYTYKGPTMLAPGIAKALLPVVYSAIIAYLIIMPLASRVKSGSDKLKRQRELAIEGVLAIQAGEPQHIAEERLLIYSEKEQKK
jgi:chemotaxis protein MotA